ncbi:PucR family transcriptional regulator [Allosaccharopolyspora coralli]|uniref:PucR family transcriptional regulator n=1 Tax=Allosaccharopolyspora coralli TaxID=2665642 RepID=UPI001651C03C|nr:PucR family transcriptional regulator [Allosaccharopolyspora coralli]
MRLRTLFDDPELGLRLLAGREELDREIRWVYTTDLRDPRRYLTGGELVLSGLMWRDGPEDSDAFVAALAEAGVAALVAGTARLGSTPRDLVNACRRRRVPLLELPVTVSFNSVSDRVILDVVAERSTPSRGRGPLVSAVADGADTGDLARLVASEWGTGCLIMSTMDRLVAEAGMTEELTAPARRMMIDAYLRASRAPVFVEPESESAMTVFGVGNADEARVADWFVAIPGAHEVDSAMVAELGTALALVRSRLDEGRRVAAQAVGTVLRLVTEGNGTQPEINAQLAALGHDTARPAWVVAAEVSDGPALTERMLAELAAALDLPAITGRTDDEVFAVLRAPDDPVAVLTELRRRVQALDPALGNATVSMGVSAAVPVNALRGAIEEARHARLLARHRLDRGARSTDSGSRSACVVDGSEIATHQLLLAAVPDTVQESFRRRLLRDLQDYDAEHQSDLINTLAVFLETACSWSRAASRLHVHVNTLRYRIKRVEEITGRDLGRFGDRVDLYLALELG